MRGMTLRRAGAVALAWVLFCGVALAGGPATQVAAVPKEPVSEADVAELRSRGIETALSGRFADGLKLLRAAAKAAPSDRVSARAVGLLEDYLEGYRAARAERAREYEEAAARVRQSRLAQAFVEQAEAEELKALREPVKSLAEAYNEAFTADDLEDVADANQAADMKKKSLESLTGSLEQIDKLMGLLDGREGRYAATFRALAAKARTSLVDHRRTWQEARVADRASRREAARELKSLEYDEGEALADLENMVFEKPWKVGLVQGRLARRLAEDKDAFAAEPWVVELVGATKARAKAFVEEAEWYDAMSAYNGLAELLPDNEDYEQQLKTVQRHVRVLNLYGQDPPEAEDEKPQWKEVVANVDADMVEKVIDQLDLSYVSSIDYRDVTLGALRAVKVLAETPQAAKSFPGLKDEKKRDRFLEDVERLMQDVRKHDRPDHLGLILALNGVLRGSETTVDIPTEVLAVEFTDGFLDELDKFSSMIWPSDVSDFEKQTMGHFFGVGIQIAKEPAEPLRVVTPLIGTPAFRAGIKANDLIVEVDGEPTEDLSVDKLVQRIMGPKGTKVILTIKRGGRTRKYPIIRDEIHIRTVKGWQRLPGTGEWEHQVDPDGKIGYIRVTQFTGKTHDAIADALRNLRQEGVQSVVVDLRFNPGGLLRSAAKVANEFIYSGRIVSTRGRRVRRSELKANSSGSYLDGDLVVLVNQYSASAAEIVSGALKDWRRAKIVGQRTYGKGSVQNVVSIRRHRALLKLTTAYYYLPKGRLLHRKNGAKEWGVDPDVEVFLTPSQTRRWLDIRRKTDIVQDVNQHELKEDLERQFESDIQLGTAVLMLKLMRLRQKIAA